MSSTERNRRLMELFEAACERSPDEQRAFLDEACTDDPAHRLRTCAGIQFF